MMKIASIHPITPPRSREVAVEFRNKDKSTKCRIIGSALTISRIV
jgi:hypothetical protein